MRIAIFTELYAPSIGGQEALFRGLSRALIQRGHEIDVFTIGHAAGLPEREEIEGVHVHRHPIDPNYQTPRIKILKRQWRTMWRYARFTAQVAREGRHDFYLLNQWPFVHALTLPPSVRNQAMLHWCEVRASPFYRVAQARLPHRTGLNAAISDGVAARISAASGCKVSVLPSGLDLSRARYKPRAERHDIVVFGRVAEHKNVPLAIAAFNLLRERGYANRLVIAGDGPDMARVREVIDASPHRDSIDLVGFVDDADKFGLLARSEVLVMPSRREGFPHVTSEAMSCGLPVVTADFAENGTQDVVRSFGIGAVTGQTPEAFADGIEATLAGWETFSNAGLATAAKLGWDAIAERLEEQMLEAIANAARGGKQISDDAGGSMNDDMIARHETFTFRD